MINDTKIFNKHPNCSTITKHGYSQKNANKKKLPNFSSGQIEFNPTSLTITLFITGDYKVNFRVCMKRILEYRKINFIIKE